MDRACQKLLCWTRIEIVMRRNGTHVTAYPIFPEWPFPEAHRPEEERSILLAGRAPGVAAGVTAGRRPRRVHSGRSLLKVVADARGAKPSRHRPPTAGDDQQHETGFHYPRSVPKSQKPIRAMYSGEAGGLALCLAARKPIALTAPTRSREIPR